MFHRHKWEVFEREFVPPVDAEIKVRGPGSERMLFKLSSGYTIVSLECKKCGKLRQQELLGNPIK